LVAVTVVENRRRALRTHAKGPLFIDVDGGFPLDRGLWVTNYMQDGVLRRINDLRRSLLFGVGRLAAWPRNGGGVDAALGVYKTL
jgi:hypothetical protein